MNTKNIATAILIAAGLKSTLSTSHAQTVLYSDNFNSGASDASNWNINSGPGFNAATFGFDYSTLGIPAAPNAGGTTIGVKLEANYATGTGLNPNGTGISISPNLSLNPGGIQGFTGNYKITFDLWQNFVGPGGATGSGTTQLTGAGIGTSGTVAQHSGTTTTGIWFAQTGDGGNSTTAKDYRVYSSAPGTNAPGTGYAVGSGVYAAGTGSTAADNANAHYSALGGHTEPAGETLISTNQTGTTGAGAPGFAWHQVTILVTNNIVTYTMDTTLIATLDASSLALSGSNLMLIQSDINTGASSDSHVRQFEFGLFDDLVVTSLSAVPEPTTTALVTLGATGLFLIRRRLKV